MVIDLLDTETVLLFKLVDAKKFLPYLSILKPFTDLETGRM